MKHLLIILLALTVITSCQKDPAKKAFLYGRLIDNCNGSPVANQELDFYRNFKESNSWLISDTEEMFLESTTTTDDGYFYFSGEGYTSNGTPYIQGSSIRLPDGTRIANGNLGEGKNTENPENSNKNLDDLLLNGMLIDLDFKISNANGAVIYDSVIVYGLNDTGYSLTNTTDNYFTTTVSDLPLMSKTFLSDFYEEHTKYYVAPIMYFYINGSMHTKEVEYFYFDQCTALADIVFEF